MKSRDENERRMHKWFSTSRIFGTVVCFGIALSGTEILSQEKAVASNESKVIRRISLGSCAHQNKSQPIWDSILAQKPDLFLFLGDNVYADTEDMDEMRQAYQKLAEQPGYARLREVCPILATWDDHDYGVNDGGAEYPMREGAEAVFHEFFETPEDSPSRTRPGIYSVHFFPGEDGKRLQVILLDTRYFRSELVSLPKRSSAGPYDENRDPKATVLGAEQWDWLGAQLKKPADLRIICSSIQFLPQDHRWERWANFPLERRRLLKLLEETNTGPVLFLSGDRHMGEIMQLGSGDLQSPGFPVYEMTSSGLTNAGGGRRGEVNRHRIGKTNFQSRNFGTIEIDWETLVAKMELRDIDGKVVDSHTAPFGG